MTQPAPGELHVNTFMTDYSVAYAQDSANFVAMRATSRIPVNFQSNLYAIYKREDFWRDEVRERPLGGYPERASYGIDQGTYFAREYALEHWIDDRQKQNTQDPLNLERAASRLLTEKNLIRQDRVWAQKFFTSGVWGRDVTGVSSGPTGAQFLQFDQSGSEPIRIVEEERDRMNEITGMMPNTLVLGPKVKRTLRSHPDIKGQLGDNERKLANEELLAQLFEVENVITPRSVYNTAAEGATASFSYIVNENAMWLGYIDPSPTVDSATACATFSWEGLMPGANAIGGVIEQGRDNRAHSDYYQGRMAWAMELVQGDLGTFFASAVA